MIFRYFLFIPMVMYGVALTWLVWSNQFPIYDYRVMEHIKAYLFFVLGLTISGFILSALIKSLEASGQSKRSVPRRVISQKLLSQLRQWIGAVGMVAALFAVLYVADGGYEKILLLGSSIDSVDFRFIGLEDRSGLLPTLMELSRRLILPFAILSILSINIYSDEPKYGPLAFLMIVFLAVSIVNLDRGPILMFIVLIAFYLYSSSKSFAFKIFIGFASITVLGFVGSLFTFLQYNQTDFEFADVLVTVEAILGNRIVLSPVKMAQTWVFDVVQQPLYLEYARISVLWGGDYVGSRDAFSYYVAPVGIIGDLFRNFGSGSLFLAGLLIGSFFIFIERRIAAVSEDIRLPLNFVALILAMYLYYGNIFSLGPFAIITFLLLTPMIIKIFVYEDNRQKRPNLPVEARFEEQY